jgi:hypothetical protein
LIRTGSDLEDIVFHLETRDISKRDAPAAGRRLTRSGSALALGRRLLSLPGLPGGVSPC